MSFPIIQKKQSQHKEKQFKELYQKVTKEIQETLIDHRLNTKEAEVILTLLAQSLVEEAKTNQKLFYRNNNEAPNSK